MRPDLILIGCTKTKLDHAAPAQDLYTSPLFKKRRAYAEASGVEWTILTAHETGIFFPGQTVDPYDRTMSDHTPEDRDEWSKNCKYRTHFITCGEHLIGRRPVIEVHAGAQYVDALRRAVGVLAIISHPVKGLQIGEHLAFYGEGET